MPTKVSVHVAYGELDPDAYDGWKGELPGCRPDFENMRRFAEARGYRTGTELWNEEGTATEVLAAIAEAGEELRKGGPGGRFLLTWSGHGGYVPDESGDEADGLDGTLLCWDRQLSDDELFAAWRSLPADCLVQGFVDACHAGTPSRAMDLPRHYRAQLLGRVRPRVAPRSVLARIPRPPQPDAPADGPPGVWLGACRDDQTAGDTDDGGVFTVALLRRLEGRDGRPPFDGTWQQLERALRRDCPRGQDPCLTTEPEHDDPTLVFHRVLG